MLPRRVLTFGGFSGIGDTEGRGNFDLEFILTMGSRFSALIVNFDGDSSTTSSFVPSLRDLTDLKVLNCVSTVDGSENASARLISDELNV